MTSEREGAESNAVFVFFTMDCERAHANRPYYPAGPISWEASAANIDAYHEILARYGARPTYFSVPEAAVEHAGLLSYLREQGAEIGLHLHPRTFGYGVNEYLAHLPGAMQQDLLQRATAVVEKALGERPRSFRAGFYSANMETIDIIRQLGFTHSSTTIPGRDSRVSGALWKDAAHAPTRFANGLIEVPLTTHPTHMIPDIAFETRAMVRKLVGRKPSSSAYRFGRSAFAHLRALLRAMTRPRKKTEPVSLQIEHRDLHQLVEVAQAAIFGSGPHALVCTTHNDVPFADREGRHAARLQGLLDYLTELSRTRPVRFRTIADCPPSLLPPVPEIIR